jgi:hypothetical protein
MNAKPLLNKIAAALVETRIEAVLVGSAAFALYGASVAKQHVSFMFRSTSANFNRLNEVAKVLDADIYNPCGSRSHLHCVVNDHYGIQLDFRSRLPGIESFEDLQSRASAFAFGGSEILVAHLDDVIKCKHVTGRRTAASAKYRRETDRALIEQIERLQKLPMNNRTHFLRVRHPGGGSHL